MTIEQLKKPRWKVVAEYPGSPFSKGDILMEFNYMGSNVIKIDIDWYEEPQDYPAIFQQMSWWEDRTEEEMPKFVKWIYGGSCQPVIRYEKVVEKGLCAVWGHPNSLNFTSIYLVNPATEEEYNLYNTPL